MKYNFKFSIIIAVYNVEKYLEETLESIINQTLNFKENVQLILVDDGSSDNSGDIIHKYHERFPDNIVSLSQENNGQASARNYGLKYAEGKYVNFLDSDDYLSIDTLEKVYDFFEKHEDIVDVVAIPMELFERVNLPHRLNTKFDETKIVDLDKNPNNPQLSASSSFIKLDAMKKFSFDTKLINLEDALIINKIFMEKKKYGLLSDVTYYYRQRLEQNSTVDLMQEKKEYYTARLERFYIHLIKYCIDREGKVHSFIQYLLVYDLQWMLKVNKLDIFDNQNEKDEFWMKLNEVLSYIDVNCIVNNEYVDPNIEGFFVYLKNNQEMKLKDSEKLMLVSKDYTIADFSDIRLWLDIIELKNNNLTFSGNIETSFKNASIKIKLIKKSGNSVQEIDSKKVEYNNPKRQTLSYLGIDWKYVYNFDAECEVSFDDEIYFKIVYDDGNLNYSMIPHISFRDNSNLSTSSAFFVKNSKIVLFKFNKFHVIPYSYTKMLRFEISNIKRILYDKQDNYKHAIMIRFMYFILYPFYANKRIWLFSDRPEFADDNAKHLFNYCNDIDDKINKYYVLNKDSDSFNDMKSISKNIIKFGSLKHQLYFLFSEKIISSYVNENFMNPYYFMTPSLYNGLKTAKRYFLQHGVTKDDVSEFIKKYDKNLSLILTVSDLEHDSFLEDGYNYDSNVIQTLGFPRFDNLLPDKSIKQILFIPTWRLGLNNKERFVNSEYYQRMNSFFNSDKLKNMLSEYDFKLVFKAHPEIEKFIDLFDMPDYVEISKERSYQDLFMKSSVLITDYSSVFFDFAYLEKPIIYYQNDDYHYDKGYFDYETMGFGSVVKSEDDLMTLLERYLKNDCIMEKEYVERMHRFFKYTDRNNSKRVYEWILKDDD